MAYWELVGPLLQRGLASCEEVWPWLVDEVSGTKLHSRYCFWNEKT